MIYFTDVRQFKTVLVDFFSVRFIYKLLTIFDDIAHQLNCTVTLNSHRAVTSQSEKGKQILNDIVQMCGNSK